MTNHALTRPRAESAQRGRGHPERLLERVLTPPALALLLLFVLAGGCSSQTPSDYAPRYIDALARYPGVALADEAPIERFLAFFTSSGGDPEAEARRVYARSLYFSDTLMTSEDHEQVIKHLTRMHLGTGTLEVQPLGRVVNGTDVYLLWRMRATFKPVVSEVRSDTIGISHLRFDTDGRVVLHQDFWDSSAGFYQHIPVLGSTLRAVGGLFAAPEQSD
ncbi:MAG: nuclear transport factor 2 family protein [Pseudomonadales bacterium]